MEEKEGLLVQESLNNTDEGNQSETSNKNVDIIKDEHIAEKDIPKTVPTPLPKKQVFVVLS